MHASPQDSPTREDQGALLHSRTDFAEASVFLPEGMLRETRRQRHLPIGTVPEVCLLDPDGDVVRYLAASRTGHRAAAWACYHTDLWETEIAGLAVGVVGCAVGAPYAVLVAEQLFASGCTFLVSMTSAGRIDPTLPDASVILIDRALRGEGTSFAYLPPSAAVAADRELITAIAQCLSTSNVTFVRGATWTTDAPYRETTTALAHAKDQGALAVEMEAAGLYAFAAAQHRPVVCVAHVTNAMAVTDGDFEKGPAAGVPQAFTILSAAAQGWRTYQG